MLNPSEIPTLLASLGIVTSPPHQRDDATVWDLELDGAKRRGLRVTLINDARKGGALLIWASFAPDVRLAAIALAIVTKTAFIALMLGSGVMKRQAWVALVVDTIMIVLFAAYLLATSGQAA
jgi:hypothetical protein